MVDANGMLSGKRIFWTLLGLVAVVSFAAGVFVYPFLTSPSLQVERLDIGGYGVVRAYHSDGTLFGTWEGHNALLEDAKNAIAACATGKDTTPRGFGSCSSWINWMDICIITPTVALCPFAQPANTLLPLGCDTDLGSCRGWKSEATFSVAAEGDVTVVRTFATCCGSAFNSLNVSPPIHVIVGDSVSVTITFSIP